MTEKPVFSSTDGTPEDWAFFDKNLETARSLSGEGRSVEQITETLQSSLKSSHAFARYIARRVGWTPEERE